MDPGHGGTDGGGARGRPGGATCVLREILIDDKTWDAAAQARHREWRVVIDELVAEHCFGIDEEGPLRMLVTVGSHGVLCDLFSPDARIVARSDIPLAMIADHLREYFDICRQMGAVAEGAKSPRLEALDIAKRLVHDEGAETMQALCGALAPDHATARRLFTLVVTLHFDTTRLVRPHHLDTALRR